MNNIQFTWKSARRRSSPARSIGRAGAGRGGTRNPRCERCSEYAPRYARALQKTGLDFHAPADAAELSVVERLEGTATTDFGAPDAAPSVDTRPVEEADLKRFEQILKASWQALDQAAQAAAGKELRKGPRGGGREVEAIRGHVVGAEGGYLGALGWKLDKANAGNLEEEEAAARQAVLDALARAAREGVPPPGPRGGKRWLPRYFVRRVAWHILDHAWEIEDRVI